MHIVLPTAPVIRSASLPGDVARDLQRRAGPRPGRESRLRRLFRGTYTTADAWNGLTKRERHVLLTMAAFPRLGRGSSISHLSAAAVLGWPHSGRWPERVHAHDPARRRVETKASSVLHPVRVPFEPMSVTDGTRSMCVTPLAMTAAELARTLPFDEAVVVLDHVLRNVCPRQDVAATIEALGHRNATRGHRALVFASPFAESPGESLARVRFREIGVPPPVLQREFHGENGRRAVVDFWFPSSGVIVEFDGESKYRDPEFLRGRTSEQAVIDEKYREDWLRALPEVRGFVRLRWADLWASAVLTAKLRAAGVHATA